MPRKKIEKDINSETIKKTYKKKMIDKNLIQELADSKELADEMIENIVDSNELADEMIENIVDSIELADENIVDSKELADEMIEYIIDCNELADEMIENIVDSNELSDKMIENIVDSIELADENIVDSIESADEIIENNFLIIKHNDEIILTDISDNNNVDNLEEEFISKLDNTEKILSNRNNLIENKDNVINIINNENKIITNRIINKEYTIDENIINNILNENANLNQDQNIDQYLNVENEDLYVNQYVENQDEDLNLDPDLNVEQYIDNSKNKYNLENLKIIFNNFKQSIMLIQIIDGTINFIEKKGYESRNQSVIDLLIKANNYKKLPNIQFLFFTNDLIINLNLTKFDFLFTFCKKYNYNTTLFPNFNFNHWIESKTGIYESIYNNFINDKTSWNDKKDIVFWTGANTNIIRRKINIASQKYPNYYINLIDKKNKNNIYLPLEEILKYKYLINMNGYSYSGRLNYLFLSSSCVIILKNSNKELNYEEYYYKYFIPNEDYIEILYNDNEITENIIDRINHAIENNDCENIAKKGFEKAKELFKMDNIYEYIYNKLDDLSHKNDITNHLSNTICYTPELNYFFKNRLKIIDNQTNFYFNGKDFELNLVNLNNNKINIKIINDKTKIHYDDELLFDKFTPMILNDKKNQHYNIIIDKNELKITIEKKFTLIKCTIPLENYIINDIEIKTEFGGWWLIE